MEDESYSRENAKQKCEVCNGPIFDGEPVIAYEGQDGLTKYVHRFTTWCNHYKAQEHNFLESLGIKE